MRKLTLISLVMLATVSVAMGSLTVQLVAVDGTGYTVLDGGKTVNVTDATAINFELRGTFSGTVDETDQIFTSTGDLVTKKVGAGAITAGSVGVAIDTDFDDPGYSGGHSQELTVPADGVLDNGYKGTASVTGGVDTWTKGTDTTSYWVKANQASGGLAKGDQVLVRATLNITTLNLSALVTDVTQLQWYFRKDLPTTYQAFNENGVAQAITFGTNLFGGAPVAIHVVPEPVSIVLLALGGLGLLRRKS
jgi:hypothetical protein